MKVCWLVDELLTENSLEHGTKPVADAATEQGHQVYRTKYVPMSKEPDPKIPFGYKACVVTHGTHEFVSQLKRTRAQQLWTPGFYHGLDKLQYHVYATHLNNLLLGDGFILLPFQEIVRRRLPLGTSHREFFIKPTSVTKPFTGRVIREADFDHEISSLNQIERVDPELLCVVAPAMPIDAEYRFVICRRKVIAGSEYRWDGKRLEDGPIPEIARKRAESVAALDWQPDTVYVCDVAVYEEGSEQEARVIELNTFSCAGLYACDTNAIVREVSKAAWAEFTGEMDD